MSQLEPVLFKKVTGLDVKDFELLVSLNVFNGSVMNDAIFKFKRYEDSSLSYTGIDKHASDEGVGGYDTVIIRDEYEKLFYNQQSTLQAPPTVINEIPDMPYAVNAEDEEEEVEEVEVVNTNRLRATRGRRPQVQAAPQMPELVTAIFGIRSPIAPKIEKKDEKPKVDTSGVAVGGTVKHKLFGPGTVIKLSGGIISIDFGKGKKDFTFPGAFEEGFLKL